MALGLDDLKKKRLQKKTNVEKPSAPKSEKRASARPWSSADLSRSHTAMNEDWSQNLQVTPLFWVDLTQHSTLLKASTKLAEVEDKIHELLDNRVGHFLKFCSLKALRAKN